MNYVYAVLGVHWVADGILCQSYNFLLFIAEQRVVQPGECPFRNPTNVTV